jgi:signal transduction histidine kinase
MDSDGDGLDGTEGLTRAEKRARELASEQAALRQVATMVARESTPVQLFAVVAEQVAQIFDVPHVGLVRYEPDGSVVVGGFSEADHEPLPLGSRWPLNMTGVIDTVRRTRNPARIDYEKVTGEISAAARRAGMRSAVASPIVVESRLWGAMVMLTPRREPFPEGTEARLADFTELVATAIANAESREARAVLTEEKAALRRVATLVAQGATPRHLFEAVTEEVGRLLPVANATMGRFDPDGSMTTMASWGTTGPNFRVGRRWSIEGTNVAWMVLQTGQAARLDDYSDARDAIGAAAREAGIKSAVGSPVVVNGHLWGVMTATSTEGPMPLGTETRLASFTELVATAIANAESSAELIASRRRIVAASDDARRRIERNLHDGVQQQLVALGLKLGAIQAETRTGDPIEAHLARAVEDVGSVLDALREIARGIHPAILAQGGLAAALKALGRRSGVKVELHARIESQLPDEVEVAAYYVAAEALTNTAKHAQASAVAMEVTTDDGTLTLMVRDDGMGGADPGGDSGLVGLQDRVEALGGTIEVDSPAGGGTCVSVRFPIGTEDEPVL